MSRPHPTRRRLLAGLAGGLLAAPTAARAFTVEPMAPADAEIYRNACAARHPAYHDDLVAELSARLAAAGIETSPDALRQALAAASCPLCGCTLAAAPGGATPAGKRPGA